MTTIGELDALAGMIDRWLDLPAGTHQIEVAYGQPRLVRNDGSVDVSPRLPRGQLRDWMRAYMAGIDIARRPDHDPHR